MDKIVTSLGSTDNFKVGDNISINGQRFRVMGIETSTRMRVKRFTWHDWIFYSIFFVPMWIKKYLTTNKLKCFFGYHAWIQAGTTKYEDDALKESRRYCRYCDRRQRGFWNMKYERWQWFWG